MEDDWIKEMMNDRFVIKMEDDENFSDRERTIMSIEVDGQKIMEQFDAGEPEDNSFGRDWCWVPDAIEKAYKLGAKHAEERIEKELRYSGFIK